MRSEKIPPSTITLCVGCGQPEYYGALRWICGRVLCRSCYKTAWEEYMERPYPADDLDGNRPTMEQYERQEERNAKSKR